MEKYFLVSPQDESDSPNRYFYWMRENDDQWVQFVKGIWPPKNDGDLIKLCDKVEDTSMLDWSSTWLYRPESNAGWLTREGRFYGCPTYYHDQLAKDVIGVKTPEAGGVGGGRV